VLSLRNAKRLVVLVVGGTVLLVGIAMLVLPGPGILVVAAGLVLLGTEFAWARRLLARVRETTDLVVGNSAAAKPEPEPEPEDEQQG
jgi:tellurite resistance protein TerC